MLRQFPPYHILFVCTGNACRSQMAEGWANHLGKALLEARSAGIEAHGQNPHAIRVMQEIGVDITTQSSKRLDDTLLAWAHLVITVCGHADEHCPVLPTSVVKQHWPLADPAKTQGTQEEIMEVFRNTRDDIRQRVTTLITALTQQTLLRDKIG